MTPPTAVRHRRCSHRTAMLRAAVLCALVVMLSAIGHAAPPVSTPSSLWRGVEEAPEQWRRLLLNESGWQVYRARNQNAYACFAFKAADGQPPPQLSGAGMALGSIAGSHGLKLFILDRDRSSRDGISRVQYGLFGLSTKIGVNTLQIAGVLHDYPGVYSGPGMDELLALDGTKVGAEIVSLQNQQGASPQRFKGTIDLTGIRIAHAVLMDCHELKELTMSPASSMPAKPVATAPATTPALPVKPSKREGAPMTASGANPITAQSANMPPAQPLAHVVEQGDTLYSISRRYRCEREALAKANGIAAPRYIVKIGQRLRLDGCAQ